MNDDVRRTVQTVLFTAADTINVWRDGVIMLLAGIVIACLWLYATLMGWGDA